MDLGSVDKMVHLEYSCQILVNVLVFYNAEYSKMYYAFCLDNSMRLEKVIPDSFSLTSNTLQMIYTILTLVATKNSSFFDLNVRRR